MENQGEVIDKQDHIEVDFLIVVVVPDLHSPSSLMSSEPAEPQPV